MIKLFRNFDDPEIPLHVFDIVLLFLFFAVPFFDIGFFNLNGLAVLPFLSRLVLVVAAELVVADLIFVV